MRLPMVAQFHRPQGSSSWMVSGMVWQMPSLGPSPRYAFSWQRCSCSSVAWSLGWTAEPWLVGGASAVTWSLGSCCGCGWFPSAQSVRTAPVARSPSPSRERRSSLGLTGGTSLQERWLQTPTCQSPLRVRSRCSRRRRQDRRAQRAGRCSPGLHGGSGQRGRW